MSSEEHRDALLRTLQDLPPGIGGGIELLAGRFDETTRRLFRLSAIPHQFTRTLLEVTAPDVDESVVAASCARFSGLSLVTELQGQLVLHDDARHYLLSWWFLSENLSAFQQASLRLAEYYEKLAAENQGATHDDAMQQHIYHLIAADPQRGFAAFESSCRRARYRFALGECQILINLVHELDPLLTPSQRAWLKYHEGKHRIDVHDLDQAHSLLEEVRRDPSADEPLSVLAGYRLGMIETERRNWEGALGHFSQARGIAESNPQAMTYLARILEGMANVLRDSGELREAETLLRQSMRLAEEVDDGWALARVHHSMGLLHRRRNDTGPAIEAFQLSLSYMQRNDDRFRQAQLYLTLGGAYADLADWSESRRYLEESLSIAKEAGNTLGQARAHADLLRVLLGLAGESEGEETDTQIRRGLESGETAARLSIQVHDWFGAASAKRALGRVLRRQGRSEEAAKFFTEASELFRYAGKTEEAEQSEKERDSIHKMKGLSGCAWTAIVVGGIFLLAVLVAGIVAIVEEL